MKRLTLMIALLMLTTGCVTHTERTRDDGCHMTRTKVDIGILYIPWNTSSTECDL